MAVPPLVRLMEVSKSPLVRHVRELEFRFEIAYNRVDDRPDLEAFVETLSPCLARLANLRELSFERPQSYFSQEETRSYINSIVMALLYVPLPNLTALELRFPICHDFGQFFAPASNTGHTPIASVLRKLQSLTLEVCSYTNSRSRRYGRSPILPEHAAFPNEIHASYLYQMLEPAINLTSLSISSRDILNLDPANFSSSVHLQSLTLSGVSISAHTLLTLIDQSSSTLECMQLKLVKLNSETWEHVLVEIAKLPRLTDFSVDTGGYSKTGASAHLATVTARRPDRQPNIETSSRDDLVALGALQCTVNANRVKSGLEPYRTNYYLYLENVPQMAEFQAFFF